MGDEYPADAKDATDSFTQVISRAYWQAAREPPVQPTAVGAPPKNARKMDRQQKRKNTLLYKRSVPFVMVFVNLSLITQVVEEVSFVEYPGSVNVIT